MRIIFLTAVNRRWSDWSDFGKCSKSCGKGIQYKTRTCTNPPPSNGGNGCAGMSWIGRTCNEGPCRKSNWHSHEGRDIPVGLRANIGKSRISTRGWFCKFWRKNLSSLPGRGSANFNFNSVQFPSFYRPMKRHNLWLQFIWHIFILAGYFCVYGPREGVRVKSPDDTVFSVRFPPLPFQFHSDFIP